MNVSSEGLVTCLQDQSLSTVSLKSIFEGKKVLVASMPKFQFFLHHHYVNYLLSLHNIDQVYLVNANNNFLLMTVDSYWPTALGIYDHNMILTKLLAAATNNHHDDLTLCNLWRYQAVINNGKLEYFNDYPLSGYREWILAKLKTDPRWKQYLSNNNQGHIVFLKALVKDPDLFFTTQTNYAIPTDMLALAYYDNLWPNTKLEELLTV
jgi:peroxiredoxin